MKPSERLLEIVKEKIGFESLSVELEIIAQYLDEQYEQQKPCEHNSSYAVDSTIEDVYYNVCNDCGVLFLRRQDVE